MAMTGVARGLGLLKAARVSIREVERTVLVYRLDQKKLGNAEPQTDEYCARAAISKEMEAVAENLGGTSRELRAQHPEVFKDIGNLVAQRNILAHHYGHGEKIIDWEKVWATIRDKYPQLKQDIEAAINDIESL